MPRSTYEQKAAARKAERERADLLRLAEPGSPWALRDALRALLDELAELRAKAAAFDELELEAKALARCVDRDCALDGNVSLETRQASADLKRALAPKEGRDV